MENQNYILNIKSANINNLINEVLIGFKQAIKHKGISLKLDLGSEQTIAMFDYEAITKVVSNLLNNAIKFANSSIEISLKSNFPQEGEFTIIVANDGKAITPEFRQRIFEPFFQIHSDEFKIGTGLGLPLVKHRFQI